MTLSRRITWCAASYNFSIHAEHIPGKVNSIADALSRFQTAKFRQLAPWADQLQTPCIQWKDLMM